MAEYTVRKGMPDVALSREEFEKRFRARFYDPIYNDVEKELQEVLEKAWTSYDESHKSPRRRTAGEGFKDPDYKLPIEWLEAREAIQAAQKRQADPKSPSRILVINGSPRSDHTCPGEISKTFRLVKLAADAIENHKDYEVDYLDLSVLTSEYGKTIYPCKACVSTAMPLCHWPCSCYPNHGLGQSGDWMNEIYPRWAAAHGVLMLCPVHWYQMPTTLKLMVDRLVCADGGNPDPTTTKLKHPDLAKEIELKGWDYPRHLAGRAFAAVVHGDSAGVENLRRTLTDWATDLGMIAAGKKSQFGGYIGYYETYSKSHEALDADKDFQHDTVVAAEALVEAVRMLREGHYKQSDAGLKESRPK